MLFIGHIGRLVLSCTIQVEARKHKLHLRVNSAMIFPSPQHFGEDGIKLRVRTGVFAKQTFPALNFEKCLLKNTFSKMTETQVLPRS